MRRHTVIINSILDGYGRFTRSVLGLDGLEVVRAHVPPLPDHIEQLGLPEVCLDEQLATETEATAHDYWSKRAPDNFLQSTP